LHLTLRWAADFICINRWPLFSCTFGSCHGYGWIHYNH
jgi:hypothetical protein